MVTRADYTRNMRLSGGGVSKQSTMANRFGVARERSWYYLFYSCEAQPGRREPVITRPIAGMGGIAR